LKAIIAIHSTILGPALGGTRFWNYPSEEAALADALNLKAAIVCWAANNPLATPEVGDTPEKKGILYGSVFIVDAGGVANSTTEAEMGEKYSVKVVGEKIARIYQTTLDVFKLAKEKGLSTCRAAYEYAWAQVEVDRKNGQPSK